MIVAFGMAVGSGAAWALLDLGRPAEPTPVAPIVIDSGDGAPEGGSQAGDDPGQGEPDGSDSTPSGGAEPPPAPPPPPAGDGDDDARDDDGDDGDD